MPRDTRRRPARRRASDDGFIRSAVTLSALALAVLFIGILIGRAIWLRGGAQSPADPDEALAALADMTDAQADEGALRVARYQAAQALFDAKRYDEAATQYDALGDYADARDRALKARYQAAQALYDAGGYIAAEERFLALGDYADSTQKAASAGDMRALSAPASVTRTKTLSMGKIAAGWRHTVGVTADGRVVAAGDDTYGQCDVSGWTNVTEVAAGAYHTVALFADGTVAATGDDSQKQCDVSGWTNVIAVAACDYDTVALLSDGTVAHTGFHEFTDLDAWNGVRWLEAGSYGVAGVSDGALLATNASMRMQGDDYLFADVSTGYAVAVTKDGACIFSFDGAPVWQNVAAVCAGQTAVLAIDASGALLTHFFRASDAVSVTPNEPLVALATGGTHFVFLTQSGRVVCVGDDSYGQCGTSEWRLN